MVWPLGKQYGFFLLLLLLFFFFTKFKVEWLYDSVILFLGIYLKEVKEEALKDICVYGSSIYNSQMVEVIKVSINGWMDK